MEDNRLIEAEEEVENEEEEVAALIPLARMIPRGSIENEDHDDEEEEEVDELIPVDMTSPSVSNSIADGETLQEAVVINDGFLDDSNDPDSCEGKPGYQDNSDGDEGKEELNKCEIDGVFCPLCFDAWTSCGDHQMCCLPCGHIYGLSCIKKRLQQHPSSTKCPQCKKLCTLKDVRVLYATRLCYADEELRKRARSLKAKCANLERMVQMQPLIRQKDPESYDRYIQKLEGMSLEYQKIKETLEKQLEYLSVKHQEREEELHQFLKEMRGYHQKDLEHQAFEKRMLDDMYIGMRASAYKNYYPYGVDGTGLRSQPPPQPIPQEYVDRSSLHIPQHQ